VGRAPQKYFTICGVDTRRHRYGCYSRIRSCGQATIRRCKSSYSAQPSVLTVASVNHIFDPQAVDDFYNQDYQAREVAIRQFRPTNYGVIRPELLGNIYEILYDQQVRSLDPLVWRARILPNREVVGGTPIESDRITLRLSHRTSPGAVPAEKIEEYGFTHVFLATGYSRTGHEDLLRWTRRLLPDGNQGGKIPVARNYRVLYDREKVEEGAGVWLQGCNESTHGVSLRP
jgi:L-ornithine N5-monooxygenase